MSWLLTSTYIYIPFCKRSDWIFLGTFWNFLCIYKKVVHFKGNASIILIIVLFQLYFSLLLLLLVVNYQTKWGSPANLFFLPFSVLLSRSTTNLLYLSFASTHEMLTLSEYKNITSSKKLKSVKDFYRLL